MTVTSEGTFTKSATLYYSNTATTLEALKASGYQQIFLLNEDGSFSKEVGFGYNTKIYYCIVAKVDDVEFASSVNSLTTKPLPEGPVDLGLSVKWASVNIGASNPTDSGRYFAWGDVVGQTWNGSSWSGDGFISYPTYMLDANGNIMPEYDAAHVILGGSWRMPTNAEQVELIDNCTSTWININGVNGILFTSKKAGYTDKSIFLPAVGSGYNEWLGNINMDPDGSYWSGTCIDNNFARYLYFNSDEITTGSRARRYGFPIRPVSE